MKKRPIVLLVLLSLSVLAHPVVGKTPKIMTRTNALASKAVVAKTNREYQLTLAELYRLLEASEVRPAGGLVPPAELEGFRERVVLDTLIGFEAAAFRLETEPVYLRQYRLRYYDLLARSYLGNRFSGQAIPDSQDVIAYYENHPELFTVEEQVLVREIHISPYVLSLGKDSLEYRRLDAESRMQLARTYADEIRALIRDAGDFPGVAAQYSHAVDAQATSGQVGWAVRGRYHHPFDSIAFSLPIGQVSAPYRDRDGWHIIMVEDKIAGGLLKLDERETFAKAANLWIDSTLSALGQGVVDSLVSSAHFELNPATLDTNLYALDQFTWAATVNQSESLIVADLLGLEDAYRRSFNVKRTTTVMREEMVKRRSVPILLVQLARATGLDTTAEMRQSERTIRQQESRRFIEQRMVPPAWEPDSTTIRKSFEENKNLYMREKPITIQHVTLGDSLTAQYVCDRAATGISLVEMAAEVSSGLPRKQMVRAQETKIGEKDVEPSVWNAALATRMGQVSEPIRTGKGFTVIRVVERFDQKPFEIARPYVIKSLKEERSDSHRKQFRDSLFKRYGVRLNRLPHLALAPYSERQKDDNNR